MSNKYPGLDPFKHDFDSYEYSFSSSNTINLSPGRYVVEGGTTNTPALQGLCCRTNNLPNTIALISKPGSPINSLWHITYSDYNTTVAQKNIIEIFKNTNKIFRLLYV